jgi:hypothetical protein
MVLIPKLNSIDIFVVFGVVVHVLLGYDKTSYGVWEGGEEKHYFMINTE